MKICLINNLYEPYQRGGAEQVVKNLAAGLKQAGHQVFIITTANRNYLNIIDGIKVYYIKPKNLFWFGEINNQPAWLRFLWHGLDMFNFSGHWLVKKILLKEKPDLVNTHNLKGISFLIPQLLRKLKIRHIQTVHDVQLVYPSGLLIVGEENNWQNRCWLTKLYEMINRWLFGSPAAVISPSQWLLDFYQQHNFFQQSKLVKLPNPIQDMMSTVKYSAFTTPKAVRGGRQVSSKVKRGFTFLYLGQIEKHKGILFLIKTLKQLAGEWQLKIVGEGTQLVPAKKLAGNDRRFNFFGWLTGEQLEPIWQAISFTILPSLCYENSPTVLYESLARGKPVIAARLGGVGELVNDGQNGFVFAAGDENDLLIQIKKCLALSQAEYQRLSYQSQQSVKGFGAREYARRLTSV